MSKTEERERERVKRRRRRNLIIRVDETDTNVGTVTLGKTLHELFVGLDDEWLNRRRKKRLIITENIYKLYLKLERGRVWECWG